MVKKIVWGTLLIGLIGILVAGAVIRTVDKTENVTEARGQGQGQGRGEVDFAGNSVEAEGRGYGGGRWAQTQDTSPGALAEPQAAGSAERQYPNYEDAPGDWTVIEGTVVQGLEGGGDLVVKTASGEEVTVGTGPGYMEAQGFVLQAGEEVQVQGYWEDDELRAAQVTRLRDGQTIALRDELGRPAWAGGGQRAVEQAATQSQGRGQGGFGQGGYAAEGRTDAPGDGTGTGQAQVDAWLQIQGTVISMDGNTLVVQTADGTQVVIENRPWVFAQEQGFQVQVGNEVTLTGFYENDDFEVGQLVNASTGQTVSIREEGGRPLWAGRGRRGG